MLKKYLKKYKQNLLKTFSVVLVRLHVDIVTLNIDELQLASANPTASGRCTVHPHSHIPCFHHLTKLADDKNMRVLRALQNDC